LSNILIEKNIMAPMRDGVRLATDVYLYNPLRPVPTIGGQVILPGGNAMGPRDQCEVEWRDDVLVYSTPVLERAVEVTGPIELWPFVSSSAPEDEHATGRTGYLRSVCQAIARATFTLRDMGNAIGITKKTLTPGCAGHLGVGFSTRQASRSLHPAL
jgi:predicted acyl esterase